MLFTSNFKCIIVVWCCLAKLAVSDGQEEPIEFKTVEDEDSNPCVAGMYVPNKKTFQWMSSFELILPNIMEERLVISWEYFAIIFSKCDKTLIQQNGSVSGPT